MTRGYLQRFARLMDEAGGGEGAGGAPAVAVSGGTTQDGGDASAASVKDPELRTAIERRQKALEEARAQKARADAAEQGLQSMQAAMAEAEAKTKAEFAREIRRRDALYEMRPAMADGVSRLVVEAMIDALESKEIVKVDANASPQEYAQAVLKGLGEHAPQLLRQTGQGGQPGGTPGLPGFNVAGKPKSELTTDSQRAAANRVDISKANQALAGNPLFKNLSGRT